MKKILLLLLLLCSITFAQETTTFDLSLETMDGEIENLSDYLHKGPVYVSFWALWCEPCKSEIKMLQKIYETYKEQGFTVLAINHDTQKSLAKVKAYVKTQQYSVPIFIDPNAQVFETLNGQNIPYSVLFDMEGNIIKTRSGYLPGDEREIEKDIQEAIAKSKKKNVVE